VTFAQRGHSSDVPYLRLVTSSDSRHRGQDSVSTIDRVISIDAVDVSFGICGEPLTARIISYDGFRSQNGNSLSSAQRIIS
jgi:hypothetical protein